MATPAPPTVDSDFAEFGGNIFSGELVGLTDDQVVALCSRHLTARLAALEGPAEKRAKTVAKGRAAAIRALEDSDEDEDQDEEDDDDDDATAEDKAVDVDGILEDLDDDGEEAMQDDEDDDDDEEEDSDDEEAGSDDDAMFRGGDLDDAEREELLAMEAEEAADGDSDDDERMLARFEREDLPFDSLKFGDFLDPDKRPGDRPPGDEDEDDEDEAEEAGDVAAAAKAPAAGDDGPKSKFERSQERMRREIESLEESLVRPAPWQLRGEIEAADRPEGGLLEEDLDFDHIGRPRPLASEELEAKLQELVKSRVKEAAFDSVARKHRPEEQPAEYRKALLLDTEKPRPLSQVYESEFARQQEADEAKSRPEHDEIRRDLNSLLARLDRLSGLRFAPQNPLPRVRVVSGAPALGMEEVRGTAVSTEASQMAPEQAAAPGGRVGRAEVGESEQTRTDRLRRRRKAKKRLRARLQRAAERPADASDGGRAAALAQLKQQARKPGSRVRILAA